MASVQLIQHSNINKEIRIRNILKQVNSPGELDTLKKNTSHNILYILHIE